MKSAGHRVVAVVAGLWIACGAGGAQEWRSPMVSPVRPSGPSLKHGEDSGSWLWIHSGVAVQVAGSFADWATSWKQPEGNRWLAEPGGPYAGRFYRSGTVHKVGLSAGLAVLSYAVGWKWPKARKFCGVFNMAVGAGFGAAAVSNVIRNPYYKP